MSGRRNRVLLVGDEYVLMSDIARILRRCDFDVAGPITFSATEAFLREAAPVDGVVIDVNLHQPQLEPLAMHLRAQGVPMLFVAPLGIARVPPALADVPVWGDAFDHESITPHLEALIAQGGR
ncbi:hypothetical protein V5F77_20715 [Xanthobacter sp. DSM 24535]|uniref:hypothetical protein n=1 Tax=Roseixanthobacter psychrophilus TaxID=3119917 RepID=UPI003728772F